MADLPLSWHASRKASCSSPGATWGFGRAGQDEPRSTSSLKVGWETKNTFVHNSFFFFHFRKCDVLNRGFSGYNTRWAKIILPRLIGKGNVLDNPVAVTIFFGANDSALKGKGIFVFFWFTFNNFCYSKLKCIYHLLVS